MSGTPKCVHIKQSFAYMNKICSAQGIGCKSKPYIGSGPTAVKAKSGSQENEQPSMDPQNQRFFSTISASQTQRSLYNIVKKFRKHKGINEIYTEQKGKKIYFK